MTLDEIRGTCKGRSAVVLGSGPSLRRADDRIYKHVTIAVNGAILKFPRSDYYLTCDVGMVRMIHWDTMVRSRCRAVVPSGAFTRASMSAQWSMGSDRVVLFERRRKVMKMTPADTRFIFSDSSAHCALNLAVILGCSPIYLIGCDCSMEDNKKYYWEFPGQGPKDGDVELGEPTFERFSFRKRGQPRAPGVYNKGSYDVNASGACKMTGNWWIRIAQDNALDIRSACTGHMKIKRIFPQVTMAKLLGV